MATKTINYELELPEQNDFYDIEVQNTNNRKIDIKLKENEHDIKTHIENETIHLKAEQISKIDNALQPIQNGKAGNFAIINEDGTISDSGKNENSFENTGHNDLSVYSEKGVHNIRYHDEKIQIYTGTEWIDISSKATIQVKVLVDSGSTITATNGTNTITGTSVNGECIMTIPSFSTWTFKATKQGTSGTLTSKSVTLNIDTVKLYEVKLSFFEYKLTVKYNYNASSTYLYKDGVLLNKEDRSVTSKTYTLLEAGTYEIYAKTNNVESEHVTVNVTNSGSQTIECKFLMLKLYLPSKSGLTTNINIWTNINNGKKLIWNATNIPSEQREVITTPLEITNSSLLIECTSGLYYTSTTMSSEPSWDAKGFIFTYLPIYGVKIDLNNSDPEKAVTYLYDAKNMTAGSTTWDNTPIFANIKPVCFDLDYKNKYELNPNNFKKLVNGGDRGDRPTFIEFYNELKYKIVSSESSIEIYITVDRENSNFTKFHDKQLYIGAYLGTVLSQNYQNLNGKMASFPSKSVNQTSSMNSCKQWSTYDVNGYKHRTFKYQDLFMLQCLYLLRYKNLNSEQALGRGFIQGESSAFTGRLDEKGMFSGSSTSGASMDGIKFCGIEDFWGNLYCYVDELNIKNTNRTDGKCEVYISNNLVGYIKPSSKYLDSLFQTSPEPIFIQDGNKNKNGSSSTYFCDYQAIVNPPSNSSYIAYFGSVFNSNSNLGGIFALKMQSSADNTGTGRACRVCIEV